MPDTECACGNWNAPNIIHRLDGPCTVASSGTEISWRDDDHDA